jgi:hypothetical protein
MSNTERDELMSNIRKAIHEVAQKKDAMKVKSLSRYDPDKVADILYLYYS